MNEEIILSDDGVEQIALRSYTQQAYLNYSMYVINDRALPSIGDGLNRFSAESSMRCLSLA